MGRRELCPKCGSKKFTIHADSKKCKVCGSQWKERASRKTSRKEKVRF